MDDAHTGFTREIGVQKLAGFVRGTVVHDDDVQIRIIREKDRGHRLHNYVLFIVRGNQYGHAGQGLMDLRTIRAQLLDERENADDQRAAADEDNAQDESRGNQQPEPVINAEDESVGPSLKLFFGRKRQHHLGARFADQIGHGDKLISFAAKGIDELREGEDGLAAVASTIMKENDVALGSFAQNVLDNFCRGQGDARLELSPIVWIHLLADDDVAHILRGGKVRHLFGKFGLVVDAIGRAEEKGFHAKDAFDQAFSEVEFPANLGGGEIGVFPVWMRIRVIANFVAFRVFPAEKLRPLVGIQTNDEKSRRHIFLFQNVENLGSPGRIRPIVEGEGEFFLCRPDLVDVVGERVGIVLFTGDEIACRVVGKGPVAALGSVDEVPDIAIPIEDQIRPRRKVGQLLPHGVVRPGGIPDRPHGGVG